MQIPDFLQIILWVAGGITALGVIYVKGLRPLSKFIAETERSVPILKAVTDKLNDPTIVDVIVEIAKQFQTDSGSSLRDLVNRLETASVSAAAAIDLLRVSAEGSRQLADADRAQIARLLIMLDRIHIQADTAAGLAAGVATDLADSHARASAASSAIPGESADAFSTQPQPSPLPPPPPP